MCRVTPLFPIWFRNPKHIMAFLCNYDIVDCFRIDRRLKTFVGQGLVPCRNVPTCCASNYALRRKDLISQLR